MEQLSFFDMTGETSPPPGAAAYAPLADRMRPRDLEDYIGQEHLLGKGKILRQMLEKDIVPSMIFWGPPGVGKTTLARIIAGRTRSGFVNFSAVTSGIKEIKEIMKQAEENRSYGTRTLCFVDEIHRFNKAQQDAFLPYVEKGSIILIGATTENPYFEVNGALLSRSIIFELKPVPPEAVRELIKKAVYDVDRGMGAYDASIDEDALDFLADVSGGDVRHALNAVELGVMSTGRSEDGRIHITLQVAQECIQRKAVRYDKTGDNHYDTISAFIKSMRGSDPDAAVYYLARMLYAGENAAFIARRIMICAAEDVGNADPQALVVAASASLAVERIGMPEAQIILSQAAAYVACAPKSNAGCQAIFQAMEAVRETGSLPIPAHLQDAHYKGAAKLGRGTGYKYAHDYPNHYVRQQYLPYELNGREFYKPTGNGYEVKIREHMRRLREEAES